MHRTLAAALILAAAPAAAHHPLDGAPMTTFADGLLSGAGHPILGFDHLFFVALAGIAGVLAGRRLGGPAAYVAAMLAGCALMYAGLGLPLTEAVIALSLLVVGGALATGRALGPRLTLALFAGFGLFHGSAFGAAVAGAEAAAGAAVLSGYLLSLGAVQFAVALAAGSLAQRAFHVTDAAAANARVAGALAAGAGLLLTLEQLEGAAFAALGWG